MELIDTGLPGCFLIDCESMEDRRGRLVKIYQETEFGARGLVTDWRNEYYSVSARYVIRGMHFQTPPAEQAKLVQCLAGEVVDVVVDLRRGSPTFGRCVSFRLSLEGRRSLYIPAGLAHGFLSLTDGTVVYYKVASAYSPAHEGGVRWDSLPYEWPVDEPVLSDRDRGLPRLADFDSPFVYQAPGP